MTNYQSTKQYDLEDRTASFGSAIIQFVKQVPENVVTRPIISQLVRSGTSIGANYCEADNAESRRDFKHKIGICKKESRETRHWLQMIITADPHQKNNVGKLLQKAKELNLIFNAIVHSTNKKS